MRQEGEQKQVSLSPAHPVHMTGHSMHMTGHPMHMSTSHLVLLDTCAEAVLLVPQVRLSQALVQFARHSFCCTSLL